MTKKDLKISLLAAVFIAALSYPTAINVAPALSGQSRIGISVSLGVLTMVGLFMMNFLKKWVRMMWQAGKFIVVGGLNTFLDFAVLNSLIIATGTSSGKTLLVFKALAFIVAVVNSYFWNKYWTFEFKQKKRGEVIEFFVISVIGLAINVGVTSLVVNVVGPQLGLTSIVWANIGALAATFAALLWNFVGYKVLVFREKPLLIKN